MAKASITSVISTLAYFDKKNNIIASQVADIKNAYLQQWLQNLRQ
jgi:hypothetical protein